MAAKSSLGRLKGQRICFNGRFDWGVEDRLNAMAEAQGAASVDDVDAKTTYLVIPDLSAGKTIQKKVVSLNAKGASIQVMQADHFEKMAGLTDDEVMELLRSGKKNADVFNKAMGVAGTYYPSGVPSRRIVGESFDRVDLTGFMLVGFSFHDCSFVEAVLEGVAIGDAVGSDFTKAKAKGVNFQAVSRSTFLNASLEEAHFNGTLEECDFTGASLRSAYIHAGPMLGNHKPKHGSTGVVFCKADLTECRFANVDLHAPDFSECRAESAMFMGTLNGANFRGASLTGASLLECKLQNADFGEASLVRATLVDADLTGSHFGDADLQGANLQGATLSQVDLSTAKNYDPNAGKPGVLGPALKELDRIDSKAKRIQITFAIGTAQVAGQPAEVVGLDSANFRWGWGLNLPSRFNQPHNLGRGKKLTMSQVLFDAARMTGNIPIRFETLDISTTKSPVNANDLRDTVIDALAEAFGQNPPEEEKLAELVKAWREQQREATAGERAEREKEKAAAEKKKEKEKKQIAKKIEKVVGKVTDIGTFLKALELRADKAKLDKATKMLKADRFQLYNDVTDDFITGVVKSQSDPELVYACRLNQKGEFSCCTQNLNVCGGLRGSACKHLLVLIIGLVKAGKLEPTTIDQWVAKTHDVKPALDKEVMGEIFIRYKGAEAGEVDWRPTETLPEDYYSL